MKMKGKIISLVLIFSLITIFLPFPNNDITATQSSKVYNVLPMALTDSGPIIITHDGNFTDYPEITGDGSALNPYRIEELNITTPLDERSISVTGTTMHFIIKNCYIRPKNTGIYLSNVAPGTAQIVDNTFEGILEWDGVGIDIRNTNSTFIANNTFLTPSEYSKAMYLHYAHHTTVFNNSATDLSYPFSQIYYLWGYESDYLTITNNTGTNLANSFVTAECFYSVIANNTLINSHDGIHLHTSPYAVIDNNFIDSTGYMAIDSFDSPSNVTNNRVFNAGIRLSVTDNKVYRNFKVENNKVNNKDFGFFVDIPDLILDTGTYAQIYAYNCSNILIENYDNDDLNQAVKLVECSGATVADSLFTNCAYTGVLFHTCLDAKLINCDFIDCEQGSYLFYSFYSNITNNQFFGQFFEALLVDDSHNNSITYNLFQQGNQGIYISSDSTNNSIHHNTFQSCYAYDDGENNIWYDPVAQEGNYWWDYSGSGNYTIPGSARSNDTYPLGSPPVPIILEFHSNLNYSLFLLLIPLIAIIPYIRKRKK